MLACMLVSTIILVNCSHWVLNLSYLILLISFALSSLGGIHCTDAEHNQSNNEKSDLQNIKENLIFHWKFLPCSIPAWRYVPLPLSLVTSSLKLLLLSNAH